MVTRRFIHPFRSGRCRRLWFATGLLLAAGARAADDRCPDLSGHYAVAGFGPGLGSALQALKLSMAGFSGSEVRIEGPDAGGLRLWVKSGRSGHFSKPPSVVMQPGSHFRCSQGWLVLNASVPASRQLDQAWHEGQASVQLRPAPGSGLGISIQFSGRQRTTLYSYDSARLSIPVPGTGARASESIRWPDVSEVERDAVVFIDRLESPDVLRVRRRLDRDVLGAVVLGGLKPRGDGVLATLRARTSDDVIGFEDRLRAASITYRSERNPVWSGNGYHLEILLWATDVGQERKTRPSTLRLEHELRRWTSALAEVQSLVDAGDGYVATLQLHGQATGEDIARQLGARSELFGPVAELPAHDGVGAPARHVRLKLLTR